MSVWECQEPGCDRAVVGCGGGIGLRAIGWYFMPGPLDGWGFLGGPTIYCPQHRPDGTNSRSLLHDGEADDGDACPICAGALDAKRYQEAIELITPEGPGAGEAQEGLRGIYAARMAAGL